MQYNVIVIGSGPGGYIAAIRCAQLNLKTAIIEKYETLGGTCLNVGCIPSKALLDSSEHFYNATHSFKEHGINISGISSDLSQMITRKNQVVKQTCDGISFLMKKNKIDVYNGMGSFLDANRIQIKDKNKKETILNGEKIIIATGSKPASLPFIQIDKQKIITSTEALQLTKIPKNMAIIGGGVIGMELGSVFARLGTNITVIEYLDSIIPTMDRTMGKELQKSLKNIGFQFYLQHKVTSVQNTNKKITIQAQNHNNETTTIESEYCLVSIGRKPYTENLGLENIGIIPDKQGKIETDTNLETKVKGIYAIGDVTKGPMLAHKAEEEGVFVAEIIAGQKPHINYNLIPNVVYTWPEVASVGYTEEQLKEHSTPYKIGSFPYKALGRAKASNDEEGLVKILAHKQSDEILGMHIIGARAADMIAEGVVAMEYKASAEDIARISHAHPTYTEAIKEACLSATENRPLNI
ncbi:MAG: dihydrolipoyl dehydrogenase [Chitinophagaceae bacterium]|nr:dihydrolipoyl dehydrogenase [Chitinophagaceae bacterium]